MPWLASDWVPYGVHGRATVDFYSSKVVGVGGSVLPFDLEVTPKAAKVERCGVFKGNKDVLA